MFIPEAGDNLPVLKHGTLVGMLSSADVLKLRAFSPQQGRDPLANLSERVRIEQLMQQPVISIEAHKSIDCAASLMMKHGIHALPVTDNQDSGSSPRPTSSARRAIRTAVQRSRVPSSTPSRG